MSLGCVKMESCKSVFFLRHRLFTMSSGGSHRLPLVYQTGQILLRSVTDIVITKEGPRSYCVFLSVKAHGEHCIDSCKIVKTFLKLP